MKKFEVHVERFEARYSHPYPDYSAQDVIDTVLAETARQAEIVASYDTLEEALAELKATRVTTNVYPANGGGKLLAGEIAYVMAAEYDEDGDLDQAEAVEYKAEGYVNPDNHSAYYLPADGINPDTIYGGEPVVCLDQAEIDRLSREWGVDVMAQMREATEDEIEQYGVCES